MKHRSQFRKWLALIAIDDRGQLIGRATIVADPPLSPAAGVSENYPASHPDIDAANATCSETVAGTEDLGCRTKKILHSGRRGVPSERLSPRSLRRWPWC